MTDDSASQDQSGSWIDKIKDVFSDAVSDTRGLLDVLRKAQRNQVLDADCLSIMEGALQVSDMQVREIMIPRSQVVTVQISATPEEFLPTVIEAAHSRFPVVGETLDQVIGILLAKDLLALILEKDYRKFNLRDIIRPAAFIPESKRLNVLLKEFRENRNHMAVVIDEYGGLAGVVTIEDVLEQIVGEIEDEHDVDEEAFIKPFETNSFIIKSLTPIEDFNEYFSSDFSEDDFDTIGGLVLQSFGRIPEREEVVNIGPYEFKVLNADNRQIRLLQLTLATPDFNPETDG